MTFPRSTPAPVLTVSVASLLVLLSGCTAGTATTLEADLSGTTGAPETRDPNGSGTATITLDEDDGEVCWDLEVEDIETATAAHIHRGASGTEGPVVVPLSAPDDGASEGCNDVEASLIDEIIASPSDFYVNVHNDEFPAGAIRGQLSE